MSWNQTLRYCVYFLGICFLPICVQAQVQKNTGQTKNSVTNKNESTIRAILSRQKDDQLKVYIKGSTRVYVNGRSVSKNDLRQIVKAADLKVAVITGSDDVAAERVESVVSMLKDLGVSKIKNDVKILSLEELAAVSKEKAKRNRESTLKTILSRQSGETIKVYLKGESRVYVSGRQISFGMLNELIQQTGFEEVELSTAVDVVDSRIVEIKERLKKLGISRISVKTATK